jgi:hypothetical protein
MECHKSGCSCSASVGSVRSGNVKFSDFYKDSIDDREKYLTAKYPNHQMALIKKRLKVEFWIDEQLKYLYQVSGSPSGGVRGQDMATSDAEYADINPDDLVDNLLDIETDKERKNFVLVKKNFFFYFIFFCKSFLLSDRTS